MSLKAILAGLVAIAAVVVAVVVIGGDDEGSSDAEQIDDDFISQMVVHHESAIEMAEMAKERSQRAEIQQLADGIVTAQTAEIEQIGAIHERMFGGGVDGHEHGDLGIPAEDSGMDDAMSALENASSNQFDQVFIDSMIPHHQGAIRMARIALEQGSDEEVAELADAIIAAQSTEIEQMNAGRKKWYGAESPAGGVPEEGETAAPSQETMGH